MLTSQGIDRFIERQIVQKHSTHNMKSAARELRTCALRLELGKPLFDTPSVDMIKEEENESTESAFGN